MKLFYFKLRVCLYGYWLIRHWAWSDINDEEWADTHEWFGNDYKTAFIEGWITG